MSGFKVNFSVNNQLATPSIHAAPFAQRPAFGQPGRVFIDTDAPSTGIYRDTGSSWVQIASTSSPEADTLQTVTDRGNTTTQDIAIGTSSSPTAPLDVHGSDVIAIIQASGSSDGFLQFNKSGSGKFKVGNVHNAGNDYFTVYNLQENSDAILVNISTNNVAIGGHTPTPNYKLDISGSLSNSGNAYFATAGSGNFVGIGQASASYSLDILGSFRQAGTDTTPTTPSALFSPSVTATANSQTLAAVQINPTFSTGGFSNVSIYALDIYKNMRVYDETNTLQLRIDSNQVRALFAFNVGNLQIYNDNTIYAASTNPIKFAFNNAEKARFAGTTGNLLLNTTTDAGYRLDCNGTFRAQDFRTNLSGGTQYVESTAPMLIQSSGTISFWNSGSSSFQIQSDKVATLRRFDFLSQASDPVAGNAGVYFNSTDAALRIYNGTNWQRILAPNSSGNVGIGTTSPNANSLLDITSTTKGVKFPSMTTAQKNAIANTAGLVVFDTDLSKLCVNSGAGWQTITSV